MSKKYYWLKLKEDFFQDKKMKKLRKIAGGDTFTIIYLKMQLLSLKNDGYIIFDDLTNEFYEEIALEIDEEEENVKVTMGYLMQVGLIEEVDEKSIAMIQTINNIGKESESAKRVRALRERKNAGLSGQKALQCNVTNVTCNTEKEKEKEKEKDINNIVEETQKEEEEKQKKQVLEYIINYLNEKAQKNFKVVKSNTQFINARLEDGYKVEDFIKVIDIKSKQWINTEHDKYLRPSTLFNSEKMQAYINEKEILTNIGNKGYNQYQALENQLKKYEEELNNEDGRNRLVIQQDVDTLF